MKQPPDMSRAQFKDALARHGFKGPILMWFQDTKHPHISYGGVYSMKGKLHRRATLAKLIRSRKEEEAKAGA